MSAGPFVVVDIGCLECSLPTYVVGVFADRESAERAAEARRADDKSEWPRTDRAVEVFGPDEFGKADK